MSSTATLRKRWKDVERRLAVRFGSERVPVTGRTRGWAPDIRHWRWALEVKSRAWQLGVIAEMMDQAERAAAWYERRGEGARTPLGVYHVTGSPLRRAYVFMRLADFEALVGQVALEDTEDGDASADRSGDGAGPDDQRALPTHS